MSRHRAEPDDDEETLPPPTADTGPLMFDRGDWPPVRPPDSDGERSRSRHNGTEPSPKPAAAEPPSYRRASADLPMYKPPGGDRPGYDPELHNHATAKISFPLPAEPRRRPPDQPTSEPAAPAAPLSRAPAAPAAPVSRAPLTGATPVQEPPVDAALPLDEALPLAEEPHFDDDVHVEDPADELGLLTPESEPEKGHRRGRGQGAPRKGGRRPLAVVVSLGLIAALVAGIFYGGRAVIDLFTDDPVPDYSGAGSGTVEVEVPEGAPTADIADILAENDVVASAQAFLDAASGNPEIRNIQPGVYSMHLQMSGQAAVDLILDPAARLFDRVTIPEGYTVDRTLETLAEKSDIPLEEYQAAAADPSQLGLPAWANGQLEGFLYPATYDVGPDSTAVSVLAEMVARFNEVVTDTGLEANAAAVGLSPYEVLTVASLIQSEVTVEAERPLVARVIYNRLGISMPLGIDAALAYELGINGSELTTEMLTQDSPYNTRIRLGLPPTPISNPGEPSIFGALQPAPGDYLYYVLQNIEGEHFFTASYEEFLAAKAQCEANGLGCG